MTRKPRKVEPIVNFSTTVRKSTKVLVERYCKKHGIRINHLVEQALMEYLEDAMDREIIESRELEETVEWKKHG
jgi:hypothetical protein